MQEQSSNIRAAHDPLKVFKAGVAKFWILLIGINEYKHLKHLKWAENDCLELEAALDSVTEGVQQKNKFIHCAGKLEPSKTEVMDSLRQMSKAEKDDVVIVYFSGHGLLHDGKTYLCLSETKKDNPSMESFALSEEFLEPLKQCKARRRMLLIDACNSGSNKLSTELINALSQNRAGFYTLLSCGEDQLSYEVNELKHGIFTYFLIEGLRGSSAEPETGYITPVRLLDHVKNKTDRYMEEHRNKFKPPQNPRIIIDSSAPNFVIGVSSNLGDPKEEYKRLYRNIRRNTVLADGDPENSELSQKRRGRTPLRTIDDSEATRLREAINHLFNGCESDISQFIDEIAFPVDEDEVCPQNIIDGCSHLIGLTNDDIKAVWARMLEEQNQKIEDYKIQAINMLNEQGLECKNKLWGLKPDGLTEINISKVKQFLYNNFEQKLKRYGTDLAEYIADNEVIPAPDILAMFCQELLIKYELPAGKLYIENIERGMFSTHQSRIEKFKEGAQPITTRQMELSAVVRANLQNLGREQGLKSNVTDRLIDIFWCEHTKNMEACKVEILKVVRDLYPEKLTEDDRKKIREVISAKQLSELTMRLVLSVMKPYAVEAIRYKETVYTDYQNYDKPDAKRQGLWDSQRGRLSRKTAKLMEEQAKRDYDSDKSQYANEAWKIIQYSGVSETLINDLVPLQTKLKLKSEVAQSLVDRAIVRYKENCNRYQQAYSQAMSNDEPEPSYLDFEIIAEDAEKIKLEINKKHEEDKEEYKQKVREILCNQCPLNELLLGTSDVVETSLQLDSSLSNFSLGKQTRTLINQNEISNLRGRLLQYDNEAEKRLKKSLRLQDSEIIMELKPLSINLELPESLAEKVVKEVRVRVERRIKEYQDNV